MVIEAMLVLNSFFFCASICLIISIDLPSTSLIFSYPFYNQHLNPITAFIVSGFISLVVEFLPGSQNFHLSLDIYLVYFHVDSFTCFNCYFKVLAQMLKLVGNLSLVCLFLLW